MEYDSPEGSTVLKLSDTNYLVWAQTVQAYLEARDHWDVVDEDRKPLDPLSKEYKEWRRKDRKSWYDIRSFCNQAEVTFYKPETAKELWDRLKKTKKPVGPTYYMAQLRAFTNYKQGPKETAEQMHLALQTMQAEMLSMSPTTPIYDNLLREVFLDALREEPYGPMVFRIRNELVEPTLENVIRQLKEREIEQALNNSAKKVTANSAKADHVRSKRHQRSGGGGGSKAGKTCYRCQRQGHFANDCFAKTDKDGEELPPNNGSKSMLKSNASSKKATQISNNSKNPNGSEKLGKLNSMASEESRDGRAWKALAAEAIASLELPPGRWIVDSGASHHMTPDRSFFVTFRDYSTQVCLANGKAIEAHEQRRSLASWGPKRM